LIIADRTRRSKFAKKKLKFLLRKVTEEKYKEDEEGNREIIVYRLLFSLATILSIPSHTESRKGEEKFHDRRQSVRSFFTNTETNFCFDIKIVSNNVSILHVLN